jgi:FdhD protein
VQRETEIIRWQNGTLTNVRDDVACEEPLEIRVDNQPISVTMRTPGNDDELAIGFLLSEGLITKREQIAKVEPYPRNRDKNVINVFLAPDVQIDFKRLTRHVFMSSSCGLCGKSSIEAVHQHFPKVSDEVCVAAKVLQELPSKIRAKQETFDKTGGLHAAAIFDLEEKLIVLREDVGRHNAVDKVLGHALMNNLYPLSNHILLVSGRSSFEIMQKALAGRVPIVAAVSAPSSLAVEFAKESGQTLVGFLREGRMNIYTHPQRIA